MRAHGPANRATALHFGAGYVCDTAPMAGARILILAVVVTSINLASCGSDDAVESATDVAASSGWWILDSDGFTLLDGGLTSDDLADSTGHLWTLEYSNGRSTLQLSAGAEDSLFAGMVEQYPTVGVAEVAGYDVTLRQSPGDPSDDIPPSVMATWADGDRLISFGGGALSEEQVRSHLDQIQPVTRSEWNAAVDEVPEPRPPPTPTSLGD